LSRLGYGEVDWNDEIVPGPNEVGFDYSFLIPATGDRVPTVYLENHHVVGLDPNDPIYIDYEKPVGNDPTGLERPDLLKMKADTQHSRTIVNGISRIGYMAGGESARWRDEDFPYVLDEKSKSFIGESSDKPFFLFYSFHDIHVPRVPHEDFIGKSEMGPRGDAIAQVDWVVGELVNELKRRGIEDNTLIIFTSDNGPVLDDGYADQAVEMLGDHNPSGPYRGGKYSAYEAGTRVPTITYWPGRINPGESAALLTQVDLYASLAELVNEETGDKVIDSQSYLEAWLGQSSSGREIMLEESFTLSLRDGKWKYIQPHVGSIPDWMKNKDIESGLADYPQLYNLDNDPGEQVNLADSHQERVSQMNAMIEEIVAQNSLVKL
jgi:arylsulfatase A